MLPTSAAELAYASLVWSQATPIAPALLIMPLPNGGACSWRRRAHFSNQLEPHPVVVAFGSGRLVDSAQWTPATPAGGQGKRARGVGERRRSIFVL